MPYASTFAENAHATLELARSMIARFSAEMAENIALTPSDQADIEARLIDYITDKVEDLVPHEVWEAAEQYDDSNPLRRAA